MNDLELISELGQETPLTPLSELGIVRARLAGAVAAERLASARPRTAAPAPRSWPARRAARVAVAVVAASAAVTVALVSGAPGTAPRPAARVVNPKAARILNDAALAALRLPAGAPRPDQYLYAKVAYGIPGHLVIDQFWNSVDGTHTSFEQRGSGKLAPVPSCVDGPNIQPAHPTKQDCYSDPAYYPDMPTTWQAMLAYLKKKYGVRVDNQPDNLNNLGKIIGTLLTGTYLAPGQRAALYELMARTPGYKVIPNAADSIGRPGVGIGWAFGPTVKPGVSTVIIFDRKTYAALGMTTYGVGGSMGGEALIKMAIVSRPGDLP